MTFATIESQATRDFPGPLMQPLVEGRHISWPGFVLRYAQQGTCSDANCTDPHSHNTRI
jgi:hypothetical protein